MPLKTVSGRHAEARKGRGAGINPEGRFETIEREAFDDGWVVIDMNAVPGVFLAQQPRQGYLKVGQSF